MTMLKRLAWNTFKNTGNIDTLLELVQLNNLEKNMNQNILQGNVGNLEDGDNKNKGNSNFRK